MTKDEVLKLALELVQRFIECDGISSSDYFDVRDAIKEVLAQPEQEPTKLWCETCEGTGEVHQEHQAGCHVGGHFKCPDCDGEGYILSRLYLTTPPQRTWVGLTDELYNELLFAVGNKYPNETRHQTALRYIQQAEMKSNQPVKAAHGIKE